MAGETKTTSGGFQSFRPGSIGIVMIVVPGAGLEPARTLPGPRDFKSRVSTNSTIRAGPRKTLGVRRNGCAFP